jgi:hypothetical protein
MDFISRDRAIGGALVGVVLASLAVASSANAATYYGCINKKSGVLRIVSKTKKCKKSERRISFNSQGPAGRNGFNGINGRNGVNGLNGTNGIPGAPGTALGFAKVSAAGAVEPGSAQGIASSNVTKVGTAGYCFHGMPFTPHIAAANVAFSGTPADSFAQVELASADPAFEADTGCPAGSQAFVFTVEGAAAKPEPFYVLFS